MTTNISFRALLTVVVTGALVIASVSCGGSSAKMGSPAPEQQLNGAGKPPLSGLPPIPGGHATSASYDDVRNGAETYDRSAQATDVGTALQLTAAADEICWGMWAFNAVGRDLTSLSFDFDLAPGESVWVAIADFSAGKWQLEGPLAADATFPLEDLRHRSADGFVFCSAITFASSALCQTVTMTSDTGGNVPPQAALAADSLEGIAPLLVNFDASSSIDGDGSLESFDWDFDGDRVFGEAGAEFDSAGLLFTQYTFPIPGVYRVQVRVTDNSGTSDTAAVMITVRSANQAPVAALAADPGQGGTPLLVQLDAGGSSDPDGASISYAWDFDGDGNFSEAGSELDAAGLAQTSQTYLAAGSYQVTVRATDDQNASDTAMVPIEVTGNQPPLAVLHANVTEGDPGLLVNFDASASTDPDGSVASYSWDLNDDGFFNGNAAEQAAEGNSSAQASYPASGAFYAKVRVYDNIGASSVAQVSIKIHGWATVTIEINDLFTGTSLALVDGRPAIAFGMIGDGVVKYALSSTPDGANAADWKLITVDAASGSWNNSLALINGKPAIAYSIQTAPNHLSYASASSVDGASQADWSSVVIDASGDTGFFPSLAEISGKPSIAYFSRSAAALIYARSSTAGGANPGDWNSIVLGTGTGSDDCASLRLVNGKPAVAYYSGTDAILQYAFSSTVDGAAPANWSSIVIDSGSGFVGSYCSMSLIGGKPAIAYVDLGSSEILRYAISSTAGGTQPGNWTIVQVDAVHAVYNGVALSQVNAKPAISYFDGDNTVLRFAESSSATGSQQNNWSNAVADGSDWCGEDSSLLEVDGCPAISYFYDGLPRTELRYAIRLQ